MAREPVAIDFIGVGERGHHGGLMGSSTVGSLMDDERASRGATRLVKPVPSVPEYHRLANAQLMSRMPAPVSEGFRNWTDNAGNFARPAAAGMCRPAWVNKHAMAMRQIQEQSSGLTTEGSEGQAVGHSPSRRPWDSLHTSAPASPSHHTLSSSNRFEVFAQQLAQQARKAASMYADPLRTTVPMRTSPVGDEAHASLSCAEPPSESHPHAASTTQSAAFGSPVPLPLHSRMKPGNAGVENGTIPQHRHQPPAAQDVHMAAAHALARPPTSGMQPQTAQLTIFYGGMVNVYDEVPLDKAQAIMLLAGKGSTLSSNYADISGLGCGRPVAAPLPSAVSQPPSRAGSPALQVSVGAPPPPPGPVPTISNRPTPTTTGVELPQARKASLARFLERRKDRVRKGPYTNRNNIELATHEARMRLNRETSPGPSSSIRPRSPSEAGPQSNVSFNNISAAGASTSGTASEPNSPKLPSPPRQRSASQERPTAPADTNPAASSPSRGETTAAVAKEAAHLS